MINYPASNPYTGAGVKGLNIGYRGISCKTNKDAQETLSKQMIDVFESYGRVKVRRADSEITTAVEECMQKGFSQCHVDINGKRLSLLITDGEGMGAEA